MLLLSTRPPVLAPRGGGTKRAQQSLSSSNGRQIAVAARARGPQGPSADADADDGDGDGGGGGFTDDAAAARLRSVLKRRGADGLARMGAELESAAAVPVGAAASQRRGSSSGPGGGGGSTERSSGPGRRRVLFADDNGSGGVEANSFGRGGRGGRGGFGGGDDRSSGGERASSGRGRGGRGMASGPNSSSSSSSANGRGFDRGSNDNGGRGAGGRSGGGRGGGRERAGDTRSAARSAPAAPPVTTIPLVRQRDGPPGKASLFFAAESWASLGASAEVVEALAAAGITRPSHVQAAAYRALLAQPPSSSQQQRSGGSGSVGRHVALADAAGSGKTLAYLLPLLQRLREEDAAQGGPATVPGGARVLIIAPTVELAQQVQRVLRALVAGGLRARTTVMTGGQEDPSRRAKALRTQAAALAAGVDIAVATPGRAVALLERGDLSLAATSAIVLDEVDILAGGPDLYREQVEPLQAAAPSTTRFVLVSATLPAHTFAALEEAFPGLTPAFGPGLHRVASGATEELVDCSGGGDVSLETGVRRKLSALSAALDRHRAARVVVFCNKIEACRAVENHLKRHHGRGGSVSNSSGNSSSNSSGGGGDGLDDPAAVGAAASSPVDVYAYHDAVSEDARAAALLKFLAPPGDAAAAGSRGGRQQQQQRDGGAGDDDGGAGARPVVLVCTDRTSRGLDSAHCDHVVLFDFPRDPSEYVRRAGRTARGAGGRGVVTVLVLGKQVPLAQEIIAQNAKGRPVHRVPLDAGSGGGGGGW